APAPSTIAAVAAMLASTQVAAATETVRHGAAAGAPVAGSTMWCPAAQRRTVVLEVASPPPASSTISPDSRSAWSSVTRTRQPAARPRRGRAAPGVDRPAAARRRGGRRGGAVGGERLGRGAQVERHPGGHPDRPAGVELDHPPAGYAHRGGTRARPQRREVA